MAVIELTRKNFKEEVLQSKQPVLIDFWAPWCGPCRRMTPIIEALGEEQDAVKMASLNVDEEMELANLFGVMSIPLLMLLRDGEVQKTSVGLCSKQDIVEMF